MTATQTQRLKGLAIIFIILFHFYYDVLGGTFLMDRGAGILEWWQRTQTYLQTNTGAIWGVFFSFFWIGVQVFFILSGYGLTKKYLKTDKFDVKAWLKQIWKILLPYFLAMPITNLISWLTQNVQFALHRIDHVSGFFQIYSAQQYLQGFLVPFRWFSSHNALDFDGTWWFVGVILQFYLLLPVLIWLIRKMKPWRFFVMALVITFAYRFIVAYATKDSPIGINLTSPLFFINFPARLAEFALGMYFATRKDLRLFRGQTIVGILLAIGGVFLASYQWGMICSDFVIGFGLLLTFRRTIIILDKVGARFFDWLGAKSYWVYLLHEPLLGYIVRLVMGKS